MITAVILHDFTENLELSKEYPPALEIFIPIFWKRSEKAQLSQTAETLATH